MSWFAENYEKAALGGAALCALGLGYGGWQSLTKVDEDFVSNVRGSGKNETSIASADRVANAIASLELPRQWSQEKANDRAVDLFVSIPLFVTSNDTGKPIDLLKDAPVHPPIPNTWWLENGIDLGYQDAPERDADGDGFTAMEEFLAGTNPNDPASHPPLIAKLKYVGDEFIAWVLRPGFPEQDGKNTFRYYDNAGTGGNRNNTGAGNPIETGGTFFQSGPAAGRFKLLDHQTREEFNERTSTKTERTFARIEDLKTNKKGSIYEFPAPLSEANMQLHTQYDRTAIFTLEAIGRNGREFKVPEFTEFKLPADADGPPEFKVLEVTPEQVVVEYPDGEGNRQTVTILKGSLPELESSFTEK